MHERVEYCKCGCKSGVYSEVGEWGCWDVCRDCGKIIEDSVVEYDHYDGEDHGLDWRELR